LAAVQVYGVRASLGRNAATGQNPSGATSELTAVTLRRLLALAVTALVLYAVAPALADVFRAWPRVRSIAPAWFVTMVVAQAGSLWCLAKLQALCMGVARITPVLTSSLASGALGRVLPGGSATAAGTQYEMLVRAGVPGTTIGVGLAAGTLLQLAALCALPLLAVPAVALGRSVPTTLATSALVSAGIFVMLLALTALALRSDRVLSAAGRVIDWVQRRLRRGGAGPSDLPKRLISQRDQVVGLLERRWKLPWSLPPVAGCSTSSRSRPPSPRSGPTRRSRSRCWPTWRRSCSVRFRSRPVAWAWSKRP
jgi:FtsH-binding integral membrane protein